jgi:hypothetical protein
MARAIQRRGVTWKSENPVTSSKSICKTRVSGDKSTASARQVSLYSRLGYCHAIKATRIGQLNEESEKKIREITHTVLKSNPMKAAPYVSRMSAIAEPGMSMCRVRLYAVENNNRGDRNNRK